MIWLWHDYPFLFHIFQNDFERTGRISDLHVSWLWYTTLSRLGWFLEGIAAFWYSLRESCTPPKGASFLHIPERARKSLLLQLCHKSDLSGTSNGSFYFPKVTYSWRQHDVGHRSLDLFMFPVSALTHKYWNFLFPGTGFWHYDLNLLLS